MTCIFDNRTSYHSVTSNTKHNGCKTESFSIDWEGETADSIPVHDEDNCGRVLGKDEDKLTNVEITGESGLGELGSGEYVMDFWKRNDQTNKINHSGEKRYHCTDCGKSFTRKSSLIVHQRIHTGEKHFMCTECGKKFGLKSSLVRHLRTHTPKTLNICPDCGKCFTRYSSLFQHQKVHKREKPYKCSQCEKSFTRASQLFVHQRIHKGDKQSEEAEHSDDNSDVNRLGNPLKNTEESNLCEECGESFKEQSSLRRHQKTHAVKDAVSVDNSLEGFFPDNSSVARDANYNFSKPRNTKKPCKRNGKCEKSTKYSIPDDVTGGSTKVERPTHSGEKRYLCIDCGNSFTRKSSLIVHQRIHTGERRFMCTECGKRFGLKSSLVRHLRTHTPKSLNICPDCGKCFTRYSSLFQHQKVHKREKPYKCSQCEKSFTRASQLVVHQRIHKGDKQSEKPECAVNVGNHLGIKKTEQPHICLQCSKSFKEAGSLARHQKTHTGENQKTKTNPDLIKETDGTIFKQPYTDDLCVTSLQEDNLEGAIEKSRPEIIENGECEVHFWDGCDILDKSSQRVERRYLCIDCGKSFTRKSSLIVHQRIHTGEKHFMCTECGKRFGLKSSLVRHLRTHSPKTLNICPDCGKCFTRYSSLFQHQKVHRREKPYKCSHCDKSFSRTTQLVVHQRTHKGEKQTEKAECIGIVGTHPRSSSPEQLHMCGECGKSFNEENLLVTHRKLHKGNSVSPECSKESESDPLDRETEYSASSPLVEKDYTSPKIPSMMNSIPGSILDVPSKNGECATDLKNKSSKTTHNGEKRYHCIDCGKSFTRKSSLIVHQRVHTGEKRFMCTECGKRFGLKSSLVRHLRTHTGHALNICSECGIYFSRYSDLLLHLEIHVGQSQITSDDAVSKTEPEESQSLPDLEMNVDKSLLSVPILNTPQSGVLNKVKRSDGKTAQRKELPVASEHINDYVDSECCETGQQMARLTEDQESVNIKQESPESINTGDEQLEGDRMEEFPSYPYSLDWGVEFDISKSFCQEENSEKLKKSNRRQENNTENPSPDEMQRSDFGINVWNGSDLLDKRSHNGEKRYLCIDCGKNFTRKSSLIVHQRIHTGEKLFMCTECGKRFGLKSSLVRHQRIHSTELFRCIECGKSFKEYSKFLQHQASHTGEWPYTEPHLAVH
ncbi:uncharacterized protein RCH25_017785 [Pelodytes ibericus]